MRIQKCAVRGDRRVMRSLESGTFFVKLHGKMFNLSSGVRDLILPHKYVFIDVDGDGITLTPTDDENAYKVAIFNGQAKLCLCKAMNYACIPKRERIIVEQREDGSLFVPLGGDGK